MAAILILAGGAFGFTSAIASLALFGTSLSMTLTIWVAVGMISFGLGLALALLNTCATPSDASEIGVRA